MLDRFFEAASSTATPEQAIARVERFRRLSTQQRVTKIVVLVADAAGAAQAPLVALRVDGGDLTRWGRRRDVVVRGDEAGARFDRERHGFDGSAVLRSFGRDAHGRWQHEIEIVEDDAAPDARGLVEVRGVGLAAGEATLPALLVPTWGASDG